MLKKQTKAPFSFPQMCKIENIFGHLCNNFKSAALKMCQSSTPTVWFYKLFIVKFAFQLKTNSHILRTVGRVSIVLLLMGGIAIGASATLGDGKANTGKSRKLLSTKSSAKPRSFSLQSGYNFRGKQVINFEQNKYINLNTVVTYHNGHTSYMLPVNKKVILNNKIVFNPNAATR